MSVEVIPLGNLALAFGPVLVVVAVFYKWSLNAPNALYALARMLLQLSLIGYFLVYLFESDDAVLIIAVLAVMVFVSSWITLRTIKIQRRKLYLSALLSIAFGGGITLLLITEWVLDLTPWYWPRYMIPLAGMIFANAINSVSLAAERFMAETQRGLSYDEARRIAFHAAMIPVINSLFAVGLVSLPGMMTGQILSGISPLIAARYQIMVMCMIFGSAGIATACFLVLIKRYVTDSASVFAGPGSKASG